MLGDTALLTQLANVHRLLGDTALLTQLANVHRLLGDTALLTELANVHRLLGDTQGANMSCLHRSVLTTSHMLHAQTSYTIS